MKKKITAKSEKWKTRIILASTYSMMSARQKKTHQRISSAPASVKYDVIWNPIFTFYRSEKKTQKKISRKENFYCIANENECAQKWTTVKMNEQMRMRLLLMLVQRSSLFISRCRKIHRQFSVWMKFFVVLFVLFLYLFLDALSARFVCMQIIITVMIVDSPFHFYSGMRLTTMYMYNGFDKMIFLFNVSPLFV